MAKRNELTEEDAKLIAQVREITWLNVKYGRWTFGKMLEALDALRNYALTEENDPELGEIDMQQMRRAALRLCPPVEDPDKLIWNAAKRPKRKGPRTGRLGP